MSTITDLAVGDNGSTSLATINDNFDNLNTDKLEAATTATLTNKTIDGDTNTVQDLPLTSLKTVLGDASKFIVRDASGIPVSNTKAVPSGTVVGHTDTQTLTNKTMDAASNTFQNMTTAISAADTSTAGKIEVATAGETTTGTDAGRAVSPDGLAGSDFGKRIFQIKVIDDTTTLTTGDAKVIFCIPSELTGYNLVGAHAFVTTVSSSGTPTIQIRNVTDAQDMLSTSITIDANEFTSYTAAAAPVINTSLDDVVTSDRIAVDVDIAGTGAKGLGVFLSFQLP